MPAALINPRSPAPPLAAVQPARVWRSSSVLQEKFEERGLAGLSSGLLRALGIALTWRQHQELVRVIDQPCTRAVRAQFPRVQYRYTLPYLSTSLVWEERWAALKSHYAFVNEAFLPEFSTRVLADTLEIWHQPTEDGRRMSVSVQGLCPVTRHREGELTLCFKVDGSPIYRISFSVVRCAALNLDRATTLACSTHILYVGRVQGASGAMDEIRKVTGLLGDVAPQDLLMSVLLGVASALGINAVIGVSDETCVSHETIAQSDSSFSYAHFWAKYGARSLARGHNLVSLPLQEKPISEIASKHRKRTLRKREFKREVAMQCEAALRAMMQR